MCGADRPSQSGAVAIIHRAVSSQNIRLLFRNPTHPSTANTVLSYETAVGYELGARQAFQKPMQDFMLQIQYVVLNLEVEIRGISSLIQIPLVSSVSMVTSPPRTRMRLLHQSVLGP